MYNTLVPHTKTSIDIPRFVW